MIASAKLKYLRVAPRKVRLVVDLIRGKRVEKAQAILKFTNKKSADIILKLLNQAIANAKNNLYSDIDNLYISKITVDGGPILKRFRPRARGSAYEIQKKTSHILIVLDELEKTGKKKIKEVGKTVEKATEKKEAKEVKGVKDENIQKSKMKREKEIVKAQTGTKAKIFRRQTF